MTHTATPWIVGRQYPATGNLPIKSERGRVLIAYVTHPDWGYDDTPDNAAEAIANAAHIVRCVNAFPELVAALESFAWLEKDYCHGMNEASQRIKASIEAARAALAKARGE